MVEGACLRGFGQMTSTSLCEDGGGQDGKESDKQDGMITKTCTLKHRPSLREKNTLRLRCTAELLEAFVILRLSREIGDLATNVAISVTPQGPRRTLTPLCLVMCVYEDAQSGSQIDLQFESNSEISRGK